MQRVHTIDCLSVSNPHKSDRTDYSCGNFILRERGIMEEMSSENLCHQHMALSCESGECGAWDCFIMVETGTECECVSICVCPSAVCSRVYGFVSNLY